MSYESVLSLINQLTYHERLKLIGELKPTKITLENKPPHDSLIWVASNVVESPKILRHFKQLSGEKVLVYSDGRSSYTSEDHVSEWDYGYLHTNLLILSEGVSDRYLIQRKSGAWSVITSENSIGHSEIIRRFKLP